MDIVDLVNEGVCQVNITARNKDNLLFKISAMLSAKIKNLSKEEIYDALIEREKLGSTGFGEGLAIPHAKFSNIKSFIIGLVTLKKGVDFKSIDKRKAKIIITILGPEKKQKEYLKLLAKVSKIIRHKNILSEMRKAPSETALKEAFIKGTISLDEEKITRKINRLLIIHLSEQKYFDDIVNLLLEKELYDALITESTTIESYLTDSPLFSGFLNFLAERMGICHTIMVAVNKKEIPPLIEEIENIMGDLDTHTGIRIMSLDISLSRGAIKA